MQTDSVFIVHPSNKEQVNALKAFVKAMKIKFEVTSVKNYNPDFVAKILESKEQFKNGNFTVIKTDDLWK